MHQSAVEAGIGGIDRGLVVVDARGVEAAAGWGSLSSPENDLDHERAEDLASPGVAESERRRISAAPVRLRLNYRVLSGDRTVGRQAITPTAADGRIASRFHARDLRLVKGPTAQGTYVRYRVRLDGRPPGAAHRLDADDRGSGTVTEPRLRQLLRQPKPTAARQREGEGAD
jgi:hypothetical protein